MKEKELESGEEAKGVLSTLEGKGEAISDTKTY